MLEEIAGYKLGRELGRGKTAAVYSAIGSKGERVALKLFFPDSVRAKGGEQHFLERISRQLELSKHNIPYLVPMLEGGKCPSSGRLYLVMDLLAEGDLSAIGSPVSHDTVCEIVRQLTIVAQRLEDLNVYHRDIKPDNIHWDAHNTKLTLLDLGVIKILGDPNITDDETHPAFLATLRYSPPEYIFRNEEPTPEGWRAITIYQIGGVLYDLIMGKRLYGDVELYTRLVETIRDPLVSPDFKGCRHQNDIILLTRSCLHKDPKLRLELVSWDRLLAIGIRAGRREELLRSILVRTETKKAARASGATPHWTERQAFEGICDHLRASYRNAWLDIVPKLPPVTTSLSFLDSHARISLTIHTSEDFQICDTICILIDIRPILSNSSALTLTASVSLGGGDHVLEGERKVVELFKDSYDEPVATERIVDFVCWILERYHHFREEGLIEEEGESTDFLGSLQEEFKTHE